MDEIRSSIMINRLPAAVFAELTNFSDWPKWQGGLARTERISVGPLRIGSKVRLIRKGPSSESLMEITHIMPNELFGVKCADRSLSWQSTFTLENVRGGTWLKRRHQIQRQGLIGSIAALFTRLTLKRELARFKALVEAG